MRKCRPNKPRRTFTCFCRRHLNKGFYRFKFQRSNEAKSPNEVFPTQSNNKH